MMADTFWHKQTKDKPLYPELLWSRPENKRHAGKLLIIGGNAHGFVAPAEAFRQAQAAGIGAVRMVLPDSLHQYVGKLFTAGELAPSTPSGSFSRAALAILLEHAQWADGILIVGDLGRNSETAVLLEEFTRKYTGQLVFTGDSVDYFLHNSQPLLNRSDTTLVLTLGQLQQLTADIKFEKPIVSAMGLLQLVEALHILSERFAANLIVMHQGNLIVAVQGQVSSTKIETQLPVWNVQTAAHAAVWWLQNPGKPFEALTTSLV